MNALCTAKVTEISAKRAFLKSSISKEGIMILLDVQRCNFIPQPRKEKVLTDYLCLNEELHVEIENCSEIMTCKWRALQAWKKIKNQVEKDRAPTDTQALRYVVSILLKMKRISVQNFTGHLSQAPGNVQARICRKKDLIKFLLKFPSIINITNDMVTLVEHTKANQSAPGVQKNASVPEDHLDLKSVPTLKSNPSNDREINPLNNVVPNGDTDAGKSTRMVASASASLSPKQSQEKTPNVFSSQEKRKDSKVSGITEGKKEQQIHPLDWASRKKSYVAGSIADKKTVKLLVRQSLSNGSVLISQRRTFLKGSGGKVKRKLENPETMKSFLSRFSDIFQVDGDKVTLVKDTKKENVKKSVQGIQNSEGLLPRNITLSSSKAPSSDILKSDTGVGKIHPVAAPFKTLSSHQQSQKQNASLSTSQQKGEGSKKSRKIKRKRQIDNLVQDFNLNQKSFATGSLVDKKAVKFLLLDVYMKGFVLITQYQSDLQKAEGKVRQKMKDPETMKTFVSRFSDIFLVSGDKVTLVDGPNDTQNSKKKEHKKQNSKKKEHSKQNSKKKEYKKENSKKKKHNNQSHEDLVNYFRVMFTSTSEGLQKR